MSMIFSLIVKDLKPVALKSSTGYLVLFVSVRPLTRNLVRRIVMHRCGSGATMPRDQAIGPVNGV